MVNVFLQSENLNYMIGILAIIMVIISFHGASRLFQILGIIFISIGGFVFVASNQNPFTIPNLMTSNVSLLTLLAMLPWMNSVVRSGRFDRTLNQLLHVNVNHLGELYPRSSATTLTLAAFLNLSAATISQDVLKENLRNMNKKVKDFFVASATLRGYTLALVWSPLEILVALPIFITDVDYVSILPWLLLIALIIYILDSLWGKWHFRKVGYQHSVNKEIDKRKLMRKLAHLMFALIAFLCLVIFLGSLFKLDFIFTVTILILPFATVWALVMKRFYSFWSIGWKTWKEKTNTMQNFIVLFLSLSFFSGSIDGTAFLDFIQKPILALLDYPFLIFIFIQLIFICLSLVGVHPIATIGIVSGIITILLESLNPISLAIVLTTSAIATLTVGSYGLVVQITSMNTGQNPYHITWINLPYALFFGGVGSIVAYLLL